MFPLWSTIPFICILLAIAVVPLVLPKFWENNKNKAILAGIISFPALIFLLMTEPSLLTHSLMEYFSFICLLGSLFVIAGGISITGDLKATPVVNTSYLLMGAVLANFIGTTGASMLLIRSFLVTNSERKSSAHVPLFFIIVVSNCGGLLTPLGDPPLFLGFLRGVPFFWTLKLFPVWLVSIGFLLTLFYVWDLWVYKHESQEELLHDVAHVKPLRIRGKRGFLFLAGVILAVFAETPIREGLMILMGILSFVFGSKTARNNNRFSWHPIEEVAILFAGIFIAMAPALEILHQRGASLGVNKPWEFFWMTGALSSFLDNAPTYLSFLSLGQSMPSGVTVAGVSEIILKAISVGAVLMGANSYIGNGPNFMVKSISEHYGYKMPSFMGYVLRSTLILAPLYILVTFLFFV